MQKNFDSKQELYQPVRWTNISLLLLFYFIEVIFASINSPNIGAVLITFFIARYFARKWYDHNDNKLKATFTKIVFTLGIYLSVFILKYLFITIILNVLF